MKNLSAGKARLLIVVNVGWFFLSHRLPIAIAAKRAGYEVHVATALDPELDRATAGILERHGIVLHPLRLSRSGTRPAELLRDLSDLLKLYRRLAPDLVHLVALKPVLLGGIAGRLSRVHGVVLAVPGRGSVFSKRGVMAAFRRWSAVLMYKLAYVRSRTRVIVQNVEDREYFVSRRIFSNTDVRLIRGSGVDIEKFAPRPERDGRCTVVFASRMLREKGVEDFVRAATLLRNSETMPRFVLVGGPDNGNPHSHSKEEIAAWVESGVVEWWGIRADMEAVFGGAHVVCLPTFYGEGVPKVLIEAAACGRAIVTTDMPGCRDIVRHGENGLLIKPRDVEGLSHAIGCLVADGDLRRKMGSCGRRLVEAEFSLEKVTRQTLEIYRELVR